LLHGRPFAKAAYGKTTVHGRVCVNS
jgi:hypothetical protein